MPSSGIYLVCLRLWNQIFSSAIWRQYTSLLIRIPKTWSTVIRHWFLIGSSLIWKIWLKILLTTFNHFSRLRSWSSRRTTMSSSWRLWCKKTHWVKFVRNWLKLLALKLWVGFFLIGPSTYWNIKDGGCSCFHWKRNVHNWSHVYFYCFFIFTKKKIYSMLISYNLRLFVHRCIRVMPSIVQWILKSIRGLAKISFRTTTWFLRARRSCSRTLLMNIVLLLLQMR